MHLERVAVCALVHTEPEVLILEFGAIALHLRRQGTRILEPGGTGTEVFRTQQKNRQD